MTSGVIVEKFNKIIVKKPSRLIIEQLRDLIAIGKVLPGERLPAETDLQSIFEVSRTQIHEALVQLEHFGIVETRPQSGTFILDIGQSLLVGMIENVIEYQNGLNLVELVETRILLEAESSVLAAERITSKRAEKLKTAHEQYLNAGISGSRAIEEDLFFHLKIVELSGNGVLKSLYCRLLPEIHEFTKRLESLIKPDKRFPETSNEHTCIVEAILAGDPLESGKSMKSHLHAIRKMAESLNVLPLRKL
ncbi:MAG: FCD domain-containing protein [Spirochaetaceae bacterium]|jgi:GntR family transcriptional repressor for pyruvate dehydrogenase complex|nr:FCD domain-containing protein [Spirochaetaceae bacterium]